MQNKKTIIYVVVALVLIAGLAYFLISSTGKPGNETATPGSPTPVAEVPKTALPVPAGTVVPGVNSTGTPADVAKPTSVSKIGGAINATNFSIAIANGKISPANINVYLGTPVNITFSSDQAYGFVQPDNGLSWSVPAGGSATIQFQSNQPGKFIYYCKSCGGPEKGPVGYFVAVSK